MQRRKFLIGAGVLAAGGAAVTGSGAFSAMSAERDVNVDVVNDSNGLLALRVGPQMDSDVIREEDGEVKIDFTAGGSAGGVNVNSRYQVGLFDDDYDKVPGGALDVESGAMEEKYALAVANQDTTEHGLRVAYEANDTGDFHGAELWFQCVAYGENNDGTHAIYVTEDNGNNVDAFSNTVPSGEEYRLSLLVDTRDVSAAPEDVDLSGTLSVSAGEPDD